jgi:hypothetical protein
MKNLRFDLFFSFLGGVLGMAAIAYGLWRRMMSQGE